MHQLKQCFIRYTGDHARPFHILTKMYSSVGFLRANAINRWASITAPGVRTIPKNIEAVEMTLDGYVVKARIIQPDEFNNATYVYQKEEAKVN